MKKTSVFLLLFLLFFLECSKENVDLHNLLTSQQWYIFYYSINECGRVIYAKEFNYAIHFIDNDIIKVISQSGRSLEGKWTINNNFLNINVLKSSELTGNWEMVNYKVWGYDQDRLVFKNNNIEMGLN